MSRTVIVPGVVLGLLTAATAARAQPSGGSVTDVEVPTLVIDQGDAAAGPAAVDEALDLANIVQSAAKGVTTVQEAPAIVTVITAEEVRDRQYQNLEALFDTVPGWQRAGIYHSVFHIPVVRGQVQAVQYLHDGVSLFDPFINTASTGRQMPIELIKRVEVITGPGGVLWGSNSLLGILNVITKDAEDVEGVEVGGAVGHGNGDRFVSRAYAMAGTSDLLDGKLKAFGHASVETYQGARLQLPLLLFHGALPQPNSANVYGPLVGTDQKQSLLVTLDGKLTFGKLQLRAFFPFGKMYGPAGFSGNPTLEHLPEDKRCPEGVPDSTCVDPLHTSRGNSQDLYDRYAVAEYRTRFANEKAGIAIRGYVQQFVRAFRQLIVLAPSTALQGGLALDTDLFSYRTGGAFDGDVEVTRKLRVLYGVEAFREFSKPDGEQSRLLGPYASETLPLACPRIYDPAAMRLVAVPDCPLQFLFPASRSVIGAYFNPQFKPSKKLIIDVGGRIQVAPDALGSLSYKLTPTLGGSLVWNFVPGWHVKLNYTQGFRPPVFNNTKSNGEDVQIGGNPKLGVESSDAAQAEVNARIWKGERRIRELSFRIDGSYTRVDNLIQIVSGTYANSGQRGLASIEFLGKLYVQGGHRLELGYTYLQGDTIDKGRLRALPEHWFDLATVFNLVSNRLSATSRLKISGAAEDPNRIVEYRESMFDPTTGSNLNDAVVAATDLVLDRIPPIAELSLGLQYTPTKKFAITASAYNVLVGHFYQSDPFFDYEPHLEYLPNPYEGFRAYLSALYQY